MIKLRIYGQPTSTYEYVKMKIKEHAQKAGIQIKIVEIKDIKKLIAEGVESIPTIKVNNHINLSYHAKDDINEYIKKVNLALLKEGNYGNMKKIIVPTDFSDTSWNAVAYAYGLAESIGGVINLTHCYLPSAVDVNTLTENSIKEMKEKQLEEFFEKVSKQWIGEKEDGPAIEKTFKLGFPVEEICEMADEENAYIVMGSTGDTGAFKKFFGSISTAVSQRSKHPVFIIPAKARFSKIKTIAYACEADEIPDINMEVLSELAEKLGAEIHLVHVEEEDEMEMYFDMIKVWKQSYPNITVNNHFIMADDVNAALDQFVQEKSINLLVMAHKKRGFWNDLFHKSHTREMSINTSTALLVLQS